MRSKKSKIFRKLEILKKFLTKTIISITIMVVLLASLISAINVNHKLMEQHNNLHKSFTIFHSEKFNTYLVPDKKITPEEELIQIWHKNKDIRHYRIQKMNEWEDFEKDLARKTKHWRAIIDDDMYLGFDEELYGKKEFYFYWK